MKFLNHKTGEILEVSPLELRLSRLRKRLSYFSDWIETVEERQEEIDKIFITLTYRGVHDWRNKHMTEFMHKVSRLLGSKLFGYFWVAEMQERGAVHYHIVLAVRKGVRLPMPDKAGLWSHGSTSIDKVHFSVYSYLAKYISKDGQKSGYPQGIRIFGCSVRVLKKEVAENKLPLWLRENIKQKFIEAALSGKKDVAGLLIDYQRYKKIKGGWKCGDQFFDSPYAIKEKFKKTMSALV